MSILRHDLNPLISPDQVPPVFSGGEVIGVFNAGVIQFRDDTILLLRIAERPRSQKKEEVLTYIYDDLEDRVVVRAFARQDVECDFSDIRLIVNPSVTYLTSLSYLRVARSRDGVHFVLDEDVLLAPSNRYEVFGLEDPRIVEMEGLYYIHYVAVSPLGVVTCLATTEDFRQVERRGILFGPENKDVVIFPERINGNYYALHRPTSPFSRRNEIWLASSPDLLCWGHHQHLLGLRQGYWDGAKMGAGAPPVRIKAGWLEIYHGVDQQNQYCLGAVLLDAQQPWRVLARSRVPLMIPETDYECSGFFGHTVFTCGVLLEEDRLKIYYGAADTSMAKAEVSVAEVLAAMES